MAIDPDMYEKYSGRSGDPYKRLGEALAQGAAHKQRLSAEKDKSFTQRRLEAKMKINIAWYIIGGIIAIISGVWALTK